MKDDFVVSSIVLMAGIQAALEVLMEGRTFYNGYFAKPFEEMSRIDKATYVLLEAKRIVEENNGCKGS